MTEKSGEEGLKFDQGVDSPRPLVVDHCHLSNTVRGLLCTQCNVMIGMAQNDPVVLQKAIEYLSVRSIQDE